MGDSRLRAVEFVARFGELHYWRIAYPASGPQPVKFGVGPAGGSAVSPILQSVVKGTVDLHGIHMKFIGAENALTAATAAYIVFENEFPTPLFFGCADEPFGAPSQWYRVDLS